MLCMTNLRDYLPRIVDALKEIDPHQIYLFGSAANTSDHADSDLDIVVILNNDNETKTYDEKLETRVMVRNALLELSFEIPIDLLVYSKKEFSRMRDINEYFYREITEKGSLLYERAS